jgi:hypothetical protein
MDSQKLNNLVLIHLGHPLNRDLCHICAKEVAPDHLKHWLKEHKRLIPESILKAHKLLRDPMGAATKVEQGNLFYCHSLI